MNFCKTDQTSGLDDETTKHARPVVGGCEGITAEDALDDIPPQNLL